MVRTTAALCKYIPEWYNLQQSGGSYFRRQAMIYMCRFHKLISWSQFKNAQNRFEYYLKGEMFFARRNSQHRTDINRTRIEAACVEHDYEYRKLLPNLQKINIQLSLRSLSNLAIYEPQTFKALVDIAKEVENTGPVMPANFHPSNLDSKQDMPREFFPKA